MTKKRDKVETDEVQIKTDGWVDRNLDAVQRKFPGAKNITCPLRIVLSNEAYQAVLAHAKESTDRELCGVLLGTVCRDSEGTWVFAEKALRGETERQGGTHVTYTHKTWEKIYAVKDVEYPKLSILGWYHTHPGFGVQFSEMDLFIQRNFFSGPTQFALVVDPIRDEQAVIANTEDGTPYLEQIWIDTNELRTQVPESIRREKESMSGKTEGSSGIDVDVTSRLKQVEERLAQVLQATEQQRESHSRWFLMFGFFAAILIAGYIIYNVLDHMSQRYIPPKNLQMVEVPVKINDHIMMVGLRVDGWKIPDGENLLKNIEIAAEKRALDRALKIMQQPDSEESKKALAEGSHAESYMNLSPVFTFWWAVIATLAVTMMLLSRLLGREGRNEPA